MGERATCRWTKGGPVWQSRRHSLEYVLGHDYIDFPPLFKKDLKKIWARWRTSNYDDEKARYEMELLFDWLNSVTKSEKERQDRIEAGEEEEEIIVRKRN